MPTCNVHYGIERIQSTFGYIFLIDKDRHVGWVEGNGLCSKEIPMPINIHKYAKEIFSKFKEVQSDLMDA